MKLIKFFKTYIVVQAVRNTGLDGIEEKVEESIRHGYKYQGGISVDGGRYYQAMRKRTFKLFYRENKPTT